MFSLVTALVSPNIIEALRGKKDTLLSTLTENANVLCFQSSDSICLLQGEWENVKKAYAILEEFYFRAQAEVMVREMLKGNLHQMASSAHFPKKEHGMDVANWSSSLLSSILPFSEKSGNLPSVQLSKGFASDKARVRYDSNFSTIQENLNSQPPGSVKDFVMRDERCAENTDAERADTTTVGDGQSGGQHGGRVLEEDDDDEDDDEDPPVLLKEGPCGADVISLSSEMSDAKEMDFCDGSHLLSEGQSSASSYERVLKGLLGSLENADEVGNRAERRHKFQSFGALPCADDVERGPPELTESHSLETFVNEFGKKADQRSAVASAKNSEHSTSTSSLATIGSSAAFHAQYLTDRLTAGRKLPQFSSLLLGSAALSQGIPAWHQYAGDLYGMHLSALQRSMHVKQEPASLISSSSLAPPVPPAPGEDDFKAGLGYRFEDDAALQEMRCARCGKTYRSEARMKEHVRTHDDDYVPVLHSCPKCGKSFTYRHNMVVHLRRFHYGWQPAKRHVCKLCGIRFQKPYLLRLHEHKAHLMPA